MRILIDTNVLFSALLFPSSKPARALLDVARNHEMILTDRNIEELKDVLRRKRPDLLPVIDTFLSELSFTLISAVDLPTVSIRDAKDQPILSAAILEGLDLVITGDKDFLSLRLQRPECITAAEYCERYMPPNE